MERAMLGITLNDKKSIEWIRRQTEMEDVETVIRSKWRVTEHIARMDKKNGLDKPQSENSREKQEAKVVP